jgi:ornithine decarboxylase
MGSGFDCASGRELMEVRKLGFSAQTFQAKVVYANPCKPLRDIETAETLGSPTTVIDSFEEIDKLSVAKWQGSSLIRILVDDKKSLMPFSRKFGIHVEKVKDLALYAKTKGLQIEGVSFHVGSGCKDKEQYKSAISQAHRCLETIRNAGHQADCVDIGGGFLFDESHHQFQTYAASIRSSLKPSYRYIAEPGRFFSTNAFDLFVQVIGKKPALDGHGWRYTIDESLYGQFSCIPFDQKIPLWVRIPSSKDKKPRKQSHGVLFGRTCDSLDMIAKSPSMEELDVGDWLWFPNMGAYSSVTASEFNGFPKPPIFQTKSSTALPQLYDLVKDNLKGRLPFDVTVVNGVSVGGSTIPAIA